MGAVDLEIVRMLDRDVLCAMSSAHLYVRVDEYNRRLIDNETCVPAGSARELGASIWVQRGAPAF